MPKYEYTTIHDDGQISKTNLDNNLNLLGEEGWLCVGSIGNPSNSHLVFVRVKDDDGISLMDDHTRN